MKVIYLHGFRSDPLLSNTAKYLKGKMGKDFISYSLYDTPSRNISNIIVELNTLHKREELLFVGSSLGGFYAYYLSNHFSAEAILVNPVIRPHLHMRKYMDTKYRSFYQEQYITMTSSDIAEFEDLFYAINGNNVEFSNYTVWLGEKDEFLNIPEITKHFQTARELIVFKNEKHRFGQFQENFERFLTK